MSDFEIKRLQRLAGILTESKADDDDEDVTPRAANPFGGMVSQLTKKDDEAGEKKAKPAGKRGRKPVESVTKFREWARANPTASRKDAIAHAATLGINAKHANAVYYKARGSAVSECWILVDMATAKVLAEDSKGTRPVYVDFDDVEQRDAEIFESEAAASAAARTIMAFGNSAPVLMQITSDLFEADAEDGEDEDTEEKKDTKEEKDDGKKSAEDIHSLIDSRISDLKAAFKDASKEDEEASPRKVARRVVRKDVELKAALKACSEDDRDEIIDLVVDKLVK